MTDPWEEHADWWAEKFTDGADPEYEEQILPLAMTLIGDATRVLDLGCGEGQVARAMAERATVVGVDPSAAQVSRAVARGGGPRFVQAGAGALPFGAESFDAVVTCLVLEHVDDLDAVLAEVARVLVDDGRYVLFLNHPLLQAPDAGWVVDHTVDPVERYWRVGDYLAETAVVEEVAKGVHVRFVHRPLGAYVNALHDVGLVVERMHEPPPPEGFLALAPEYREAGGIPRLLVLECRKR